MNNNKAIAFFSGFPERRFDEELIGWVRQAYAFADSK